MPTYIADQIMRVASPGARSLGSRTMSPLFFVGLLLSVVGLLSAPPSRASACASCAVGDPTLTTMGLQQPVDGRIRASAELQWRSDAVGEPGQGRLELVERRAGLAVAYAPANSWMLSASLPLLWRTISYGSGAEDTLTGVGDAELRSRWVLWQDRDFAPEHVLSGLVGLGLPTGPVHTMQDASRDPTVVVAPELQAGTGSFTPLVGLSFGYFGGRWSFFASEVFYWPVDGRAAFHVGASFRGSHTLQYSAVDWLSLRLSANARIEAATFLKDPREIEPDSGGAIVFVAPGVMVSPWQDLVIYADLQLPAVNALVGRHDEGPMVLLGIAYDL